MMMKMKTHVADKNNLKHKVKAGFRHDRFDVKSNVSHRFRMKISVTGENRGQLAEHDWTMKVTTSA